MVGTAAIPTDPTEQEYIYFDFGPGLAWGVTINGTPTVTCSVVVGNDPAPQSRVLSAPQVIASAETGAPLQCVKVLVGNMVPGTTYQLWCLAPCSNSETKSIRWNLPCSSPPNR